MTAHFYRYYDIEEPIDVHEEMNCINNILSRLDHESVWNKTYAFKIEEADPWHRNNMVCCYYFKSVDF